MNRTKVKEATISADQSGQRLDNFLLRELKGVPKSRIYKMFRKGEVRVNKGRIKPSYKLNEGDIVRIPPVNIDSFKKELYISDINKEKLKASIIHEDSNLLVINKPAGLPVHAGSKLAYGVIEIARATFPNLENIELGHRLDRFTSGVLVMAKNRQTLIAFQAALGGAETTKSYLCLVKGKWPRDLRSVDLALQRDRSGQHSKTIVSESGKDAKSSFEVIDYYKNNSLLKVEIHTGRTHQIRVHTAATGYPVIGDDLYGDVATNKRFAEMGLSRQFLHASYLQLPINDEVFVFNAPLADDLNQVLKAL